jgi:hypothetical protein
MTGATRLRATRLRFDFDVLRYDEILPKVAEELRVFGAPSEANFAYQVDAHLEQVSVATPDDPTGRVRTCWHVDIEGTLYPGDGSHQVEVS